MADLRENVAFALLASVSGVDMQAVAKTDLFTVPVGKKCVITGVVVRQPTASLAGGNDYDLGDGAAADTWKTGADFSSMTLTTHYHIATEMWTTKVVFDAGDVFGIKPITGSTLAATATLDVYGYLFDA